MKVDDLWADVKKLLGRKSGPHDALRSVLSALMVTPEGRSKIIRELDLKFTGMMALLKQIALVLDPQGECSTQVAKKDLDDVLESAAKAARSQLNTHAAYWAFLWLRLKCGQATIASDAAKDLRALNKERQRPQDLLMRLSSLKGWTDFPKNQWIELIDKARGAELSADFRSSLQQVLELLRGGGEPVPPKTAVSSHTSAPSLVAGQPSTVDQKPPTTGARGAAGQATNKEEDKKPQKGENTSTARIPPRNMPTSRNEPTVNAAFATEETATIASPTSQLQRGVGNSSPSDIPDPATDLAVGQLVIPEELTATTATDEADGVDETKGHRPKRTTVRKTVSIEDAKADGLSTEISSRADLSESGVDGEIPAVLTELSAAVRVISGRIDQIASQTGNWASLEQRLVKLEQQSTVVERAISDTQSDAQRAHDEVDRLRTRLRECEQELEDVIRERTAAVARSDDLAQRLALADARIAAAESRADQNIHEAFRERDAAVLTFKARLWDKVQAQLSDVTETTPGEEFASTEEEVLTTRLRNIRDTLRAEGVSP